MIKWLPILPFVGAMVLVSCGGSDPVAEDAIAPPENVLGDEAAEGLAAPANAAAAERAVQAATPPGTSGLRWAFRAAERTAFYGPREGGPVLAIQCRGEGSGRQMVFTRFASATSGAKGTLSFTGNGAAASLPVTGSASDAGLGALWQAVVPVGDMARDVAKTFAGEGPVNVGVGGSPALAVPSSATARRPFAECLG